MYGPPHDCKGKAEEREGEHCVIADLIGNGKHIRTVPVPAWPSLKRRLIPPLPIKLHNENSRIIDGVPCCGAKGHSTEGVIRPRACLGFIFTQIVVAGSRGAKSMPSIA